MIEDVVAPRNAIPWNPTGMVVLLVVAASAVVAIGATGVGLLVPPANLNAGWAWGVRIAGSAAAAAGLAGLVVQRKRIQSNVDRRHDPSVAALLTAATMMGVLALLALLAPAVSIVSEAGPDPEDMVATEDVGGDGEGTRTGTAVSIEGLGLGAVREGRDRRIMQRGEGGTPVGGDGRLDGSILDRLGNVLQLVLLLAVVVTGIRAVKGRLGQGQQQLPAEVPIAAADAEAGLQASLGEVAYEGQDPRRQITAAYRRLLGALAEAGVARLPQEAPHEHLRRALGPLGVRAEPMHRLTELYVVAQFSERSITEGHRAAAAEALEVALVSLRPANDASGAAGTGPVPEKVTA